MNDESGPLADELPDDLLAAMWRFANLLHADGWDHGGVEELIVREEVRCAERYIRSHGMRRL